MHTKLTVSEHIAKLLRNHECVIIPDLGGFLVKNSPASFSSQGDKIRPPGAELQFHTHLRNNDGLLIQSIMEEDNISYDEASQRVSNFIQESKTQLNDTKSTIIPNVGKIYVDGENTVLFSPNIKSNFNPNSYGLPVIKAKKIKRAEIVSESVVREIKKKRRSPVAFAFTAAASILVLALAASLFLLHQGTDEQQKTIRAGYGDLLKPFVKPSAEKESVEEEPTSYEIIETEQNNLVDDSENLVESSEKQEEEATTAEDMEIHVARKKSDFLLNKIPTASPENTDFHVVIGMFFKENNAQNRYKEALDLGYENARLIKGRKYHRVVIPYSKADATWKNAVTELRQTIEPGAWIWETLYY